LKYEMMMKLTIKVKTGVFGMPPPCYQEGRRLCISPALLPYETCENVLFPDCIQVEPMVQ